MERPLFRTSDREIDRTGKNVVTAKLQALIDETAAAGGTLLLEKGTYLTASLFLKSNMEFRFEEGAPNEMPGSFGAFFAHGISN